MASVEWVTEDREHLANLASIRGSLRSLRSQIRWFVTLDGISRCAIWSCLFFWGLFLVDRLPVYWGGLELSAPSRILAALVWFAVFLAIGFRGMVARMITPLSDQNMALALERRFPALRERLLTSVDAIRSGSTLGNPELVRRTVQSAALTLKNVSPSQVLRYDRLVWLLMAAVAGFASIGAFRVVGGDTWEIAKDRLLLFGDRPWPRRARIELLGVETPRPARDLQETRAIRTIPFVNRSVKVGRGSSIFLKVGASTDASLIPSSCRAYIYSKRLGSSEGVLSKIRGPKEGNQIYRGTAPLLQAMTDRVSITVVGGDARLDQYSIEITDLPSIVDVRADVTFPPYLAQSHSETYSPRKAVPVVSGATRYPVGSQLEVSFQCSKPISEVELRHLETGRVENLSASESDDHLATYRISSFSERVNLEVSVRDTDLIDSVEPFRVLIQPTPDTAPSVAAHMEGVGTSITPDAILRVVGAIGDDYGVSESWLEFGATRLTDPEKLEVTAVRGAAVVEVDLRSQRRETEAFAVLPGDKVTLRLNARDNCQLTDSPNLGQSDAISLDVVTAEQLINMLDSRELGLRRRLEHVLEELTDMRDSLLRVRSKTGSEPNTGDSDLAGEDRADSHRDSSKDAERAENLRSLRIDRAASQIEKSRLEVGGVAKSLALIRDEIDANRLDVEDRRERLQNKVVTPLSAIAESGFSPSKESIERLRATKQQNEIDLLANESIDRVNQLISQIDSILKEMIDLESFNEVVEMVRDIARQNKQLMEETRRLNREAQAE